MIITDLHCSSHQLSDHTLAMACSAESQTSTVGHVHDDFSLGGCAYGGCVCQRESKRRVDANDCPIERRRCSQTIEEATHPTDAVMISSIMGFNLISLALQLFRDLYVWTTVFASLAVLHMQILSGCSDAAMLDAGYDCFWVPSLKQRLDTSDFDFATCTLQDQANHTSADYHHLTCYRFPDAGPAAILAAAGTAAVVVTTIRLVQDSLRRAAVVWCTSRLDKLPDPPTETGALGLHTVEKATITKHINRVKKVYTDRASVPRRVGLVVGAILFIAVVSGMVVMFVQPTLFASPTDFVLVVVTVLTPVLAVQELCSGGCPIQRLWDCGTVGAGPLHALQPRSRFAGGS